MKFGPMALATHYCRGTGIELGRGTQNPFDLPSCRNVAPSDGSNFVYRQDLDDYLRCAGEQGSFSEEVAKVDLVGDMQQIPIDDGSLDYVLSSHVVEHEPNPIKAFMTINRKLRDGGVAFFVFPKRNAVHIDAIRPLTTQDEFIAYYLNDRTPLNAGMKHRTHYCVYSLQSFLRLAAWCNRNLFLGWKIEAIEETDSKVGNGHTAVFRKDDAFAGAVRSGSGAEAEYAAALEGVSGNEQSRSRLEEALTSLRRSISLDFVQPEALYLIAQILKLTGEVAQSREFMQQALVFEPENGLFRKYYYETYGRAFAMPTI